MSNPTCRWSGVEFQVLRKDSNWLNTAGIYIFARVSAGQKWEALYIGQASSFADRIPNHERWDDAVKRGATHVHALVVPTQVERDRLEKDLIKSFQPSLNDHHREESTTTTFDVAHFEERGQKLVVVFVASSFGLKSNVEQNETCSALQGCARAAGLTGIVVPVWDTGGGSMGFFATTPWHGFFRGMSLGTLARKKNRKLTCG